MTTPEPVRKDRLSSRVGRPVTQPCGTWAAATRHRRHGEPLCDACRAAVVERNAEQYRRRVTHS